MSTTTTAITYQAGLAPAGDPVLPHGAARLKWAVADTLTITKRNLIALTRTPEALFFSTLQPIMFVLLFRYVFGGAIHPPLGLTYIDFLMAGIFIQSVGFGGIGTAVGLSEDLQKGLIERFRALPMARSAVLAGRTTADLVRNVFVLLLMTGVGALVGFDFPNGAPRVHRGVRPRPALRLRAAVGVRRHRARRLQQRDRSGHGLPHPVPLDLRLARVRAAHVHARLAPVVRHQPAHRCGDQRTARPHARRPVRAGERDGTRPGGTGLVRGVAARVRAARGVALPPYQLTRPSHLPEPRRSAAGAVGVVSVQRAAVSTGGPVVGVVPLPAPNEE